MESEPQPLESQSPETKPEAQSTGIQFAPAPPIESVAADGQSPECAETTPLAHLLCPFVAAVVTAVGFDVCVYRGHGYAGWGAFFAVAMMSYLLGTPHRRHLPARWLVAGMLLLLALRMIWMGSPDLVTWGLLLLPALAMSCWGVIPSLFDFFIFAMQSCTVAGYGFWKVVTCCLARGIRPPRVNWLAILLPLFAVALFGIIFVQANPDLAAAVDRWRVEIVRHIIRFIEDIDIAEFVVVAVVTWFAFGQLLPVMKESTLASLGLDTPQPPGEPNTARMYLPFRNTLWSVIALFIVYLVFEFQTLWFREFPEGFYYAGYAHEGAAWLTFALALATLMLSGMFRASILSDPRIAALKRLAWGWSALNFVLALAVYNRLLIYINFNGLTRMRILGLFGISTVVVGFLFVVWKIARERRFLWLINRQLWTLAIALYLLALTPVDVIVHTYNVRQILAGHLAPSVQITEHPVDNSGWLVLHQLIDCDDEIIREGIRARLAEIDYENRADSTRRRESTRDHWTRYQLVESLLQARLESSRDAWAKYESEDDRTAAWSRYREYAYQWY